MQIITLLCMFPPAGILNLTFEHQNLYLSQEASLAMLLTIRQE